MDMRIDLINHHLASPFVGRCLSEVLFMCGNRTYPGANLNLGVFHLGVDNVRSMPQPARGGQFRGGQFRDEQFRDEQSRGGQSRDKR